MKLTRKQFLTGAGASAISLMLPRMTLAADCGPGTFPLPSGHFVPAKRPLSLVYPRPDTETHGWARHRKAYYDGTNPVLYSIPVGVQFGSWPYKYELLAGPTGMSIGQYYGSSNYGRVTWTPTSSVTSATVTVRVTDQELNYIDVTWTVRTSSSTSDFIFIAPTGSDTTGTGTISAPFQTLQKVFGAAYLTLLHANASLYMRGGTYAGYDQTGSGAHYGIGFGKDITLMSMMGFPGETVQISMAGSGDVSQFNTNGANGEDLFFQNFSVTGHPVTNNFRVWFMGQEQDRVTFDRITAPDVYQGSDADDNATLIYFNSSGTGTYRNFIFINECVETNRGVTGGGGNSWALCCLFVSQYVLVQNCTVTGSVASRALYMKASCADVTERGNYVSGSPMVTGCQVDAGLDNTRFEYCYNTTDVGLVANGEFTGAGAKQHWFYRNTIRGAVSVNGDDGTNGPFEIESNAIETPSGYNPVLTNYTNNPPGAHTSVTNAECHGSSGILDSALKLTGTYRTLWLGQRGAEIA